MTPVRNTGQLYLPQALTDHPDLAFGPGDDVRLRVLECGAIFAWPAGELPIEPVVVPPPRPEALPWPLATTGATYEDLRDPDVDVTSAIDQLETDANPTQ